MPARRPLPALACAAALLVAGCGGGDDEGAEPTAQAQQSADAIAACIRKAGYEVEVSDTNFTKTSLTEGQDTEDIHALELELPASARSGASMQVFVFRDQDLANEKLENVKALESNVELKGNAILAYGQDYNRDTYKKVPACIPG